MESEKEIIKKVKALFDKEKYTNVISILTDELLEKTQSSDLFGWRSWTHFRLNENEQALKYAEKAISLNPSNFFGYRQRGSAYKGLNEYAKAISDYNKSIELKNDDSISYYNRGSSWHKIRDYDKALIDLNKAIELEKTDAASYVYRGTIYSDKRDYEKALADFNHALLLNKNYSYAYNNRGNIWFNLQKYDEAIKDYDNAIRTDRNNTTPIVNRGRTYHIIGDFQKAIDDFQKAMGLDKSLVFLENNIKLAKEKLDERGALEESEAKPDDKKEKLELEKKIETAINSIREISKSEVKTVVHYTKVAVADIYVTSLIAKMHYSNAIYMNDPMEGKVFFEFLNNKKIAEAYLNGEKRTETSVYLGSFLPAEENDGEISHEDELVMWRTYGKDENGKEAAGCCVILSSDFFKTEVTDKEERLVDVSQALLNVVYIKNQKHQKKIANDFKGEIEAQIKHLKVHLIKLIKIRDNYKPKDDFYKDIENTIFKLLSTISYLFKSADYEFEHEVRVITYMPRNSDSVKHKPNGESNAPRKRFYIESYNDILPFVKKIYLGPKVEHYQQWSLYFDYEIRQRAKELKAMTPAPYRIKPSDIEIMKSECKFQ
jgi:tetratricopeptide (TPR) repeat protein